MPTMLKTTPYLFAALVAATACAQQPTYEPNSSSSESLSNASGELNSLSFWQDKVDTQKCSSDFEAPDERLVHVLNLTDERKLLQIACEFGAYQDGYQSYVIDNTGEILKTVRFIVPSDENPTSLHTQDTVWGSLSLSGQSELELLHLSAGSGACGYRVTYTIDSILSGTEVTPKALYADSDCYNGKFVPEWPKIDLSTAVTQRERRTN
ncbi:MAG TPA: DUF1176 domain-containing protein [Marinagarivorans sp.]